MGLLSLYHSHQKVDVQISHIVRIRIVKSSSNKNCFNYGLPNHREHVTLHPDQDQELIAKLETSKKNLKKRKESTYGQTRLM